MQDGFILHKHFLSAPQVDSVEKVLRDFHNSWMIKNSESYQKGAINSAYITNGEFISSQQRLELLKFVGSAKVVDQARSVLGPDIRFLNTQIFFNPANQSQNNYWHRDIQYTGLSEADQREAIEKQMSTVLHLRIAMADEPGLEFVPGSQFRWDNAEEFEVRLQKNGKKNYDSLVGSRSISMQKGDLLIFDANIIHRGLYGMNRFAFDILFCKPLPELLKFINPVTHSGSAEDFKSIECPEVFSLG